jgi:integrase
MRLAAYLNTSRHGVFYFRWPIPATMHPEQKRFSIRVSLETRCPRMAQRLSRLLVLAGHSALTRAKHGSMTYNEIRQHVQEHFRELLLAFKRGIASDGPPDAHRLNALRATEGLASGDPETWRAATYPADDVALLSDFCARRDIALADLSEANRGWLLDTLQAGHASMASEALNYVSSLAHFDMADATQQPSTTAPQMPHALPIPANSKSVDEVAAIYFDEIRRTAPVEPKTELDRKEVLDLLDEITGHKPVAAITKRDAQEVKRVLLRLPWNRNKMAATRGKTLVDMLALEGVRVISPRRVTTHLGNLRAFFKWAAANGHVEVNVFDGMQVKAVKKPRDEQRGSFNAEQLQAIFRHLADNPDGLVRRDVHKWGTLIAMFSGMRVNEVAQLDIADIKQDGEVWYFDITKGEDDKKSLKNEASQRRLPVHKRLIECGLLDYIAAQRDAGHKRLFHELSYSEMNHYGRNLGRWVRDSFLPALGIKTSVLTFHSFRHTMATRLAQVDAPERHVPAIMGHQQAGMTYSTYFKEGFLPAQLKVTIDLYDF